MNCFKLLILLLFATVSLTAQNDINFEEPVDSVLFEDVKNKPKTGILIKGNYQLVFPAANFKDRFGISSMAGAGFYYKNAKNWIYGADFNVMFGTKINENIGGNLTSASGTITGKDGSIAAVQPQLRGFNLFFKVGKTINLFKKNKDSGIHLSAGYGFIQHKVKFENFSDNLPQLSGEYAKGYDRLTNGNYFIQSATFIYLSGNNITNFEVGLELGEGITKSRRDFNFDTMSTDTKTRFDFLIGLKFSIFVPIFLSDKEEYFYY